jgi:hypothetical protein
VASYASRYRSIARIGEAHSRGHASREHSDPRTAPRCCRARAVVLRAAMVAGRRTRRPARAPSSVVHVAYAPRADCDCAGARAIRSAGGSANAAVAARRPAEELAPEAESRASARHTPRRPPDPETSSSDSHTAPVWPRRSPRAVPTRRSRRRERVTRPQARVVREPPPHLHRTGTPIHERDDDMRCRCSCGSLLRRGGHSSIPPAWTDDVRAVRFDLATHVHYRETTREPLSERRHARRPTQLLVMSLDT